MSTPRVERLLIEAMAKHLPPSGSTLHLVDVGGKAANVLQESRPDIVVIAAPDGSTGWSVSSDSADAVVAYDRPLTPELLASALTTLRPGGRLIVMDSQANPQAEQVKTLEDAGYDRILVEVGAECPLPVGALMRGEKPHTEAHTVNRVQQVAQRDAAPRPGRYVHLLIRQTPNKPVWKLKKQEKIEWQAVGVEGYDEQIILGFSSLPKAVAFMQSTVMAGTLSGISKIAKFRWDVAHSWPFSVLLNPTDDIVTTNTVILLTVDPDSAEKPDE